MSFFLLTLPPARSLLMISSGNPQKHLLKCLCEISAKPYLRLYIKTCPCRRRCTRHSSYNFLRNRFYIRTRSTYGIFARFCLCFFGGFFLCPSFSRFFFLCLFLLAPFGSFFLSSFLFFCLSLRIFSSYLSVGVICSGRDTCNIPISINFI